MGSHVHRLLTKYLKDVCDFNIILIVYIIIIYIIVICNVCRVGEVLKGDECMYAISQGAMAVECRSFDLETLDLLSPLTHRDSLVQCLSERALLRTLEGGCSVPIAASSQVCSRPLVGTLS